VPENFEDEAARIGGPRSAAFTARALPPEVIAAYMYNIYIYIYIYIYAYMYYVYIYIYIHTYIHTYMYIYM
jgi:hypothetical protein